MRIRFLVLAAVVCAAPGAARAEVGAPVVAPPAAKDDSASAAIVRFDLHGTRDVEQRLFSTLRAALAERLAVVPPERVDALRRESPSLLRCATRECLRRLGGELGARLLVDGRVDYDGSSYAIEIGLVEAASGRTVARKRGVCELCGWTDVPAKVMEVVGAAVGASGVAAPPPVAPPEKVHGGSELPGPEARVPQPPLEPPVRPTRHRRPYAIAGGLVAAVAIGMLATGAVMLAYDGHPTCDAPPGLRCQHVYDTRLEGGLFVGAGALAAAGSAALLWLDLRRAHPLVPQIAVDAKGAAIEWSLRF